MTPRLRIPALLAVGGVLTALLVVVGGRVALAAPSEPIPGAAWQVGGDGTVSAMTQVGSTLYLGGSFSYVGPDTGAGAVVDRSTGEVTSSPYVAAAGHDPIDGGVDVALPDGAGGYYLGGGFAAIGDTPVANLAHVRADGTLDTSFEPEPDGEVLTMQLSGGVLFIGGRFTTVGGKSRPHVAALDLSGSPTQWSPQVDGDVSQLLVSDGDVYLRGDFEHVGAASRAGLAGVDVGTGLPTAFAPVVGGVNAMALAGGRLIIGGSFAGVDGVPMSRLAALDLSDGSLVGGWPAAAPSAYVTALAVDGTTVYVADGDGTVLDMAVADGSVRRSLVALSGGSETVTSLVADAGTLYVGGDFTGAGGVTRHDAAAVDTATGTILPWAPSPDGPPHTFAPVGDGVYVGGAFDSVGGVSRSNLAAIDLSTGRAMSWAPQVEGSVDALASDGHQVYVGGQFTLDGAEVRSDAAAFDATTGTATSWDPAPDGPVDTLAVDGPLVYAGGAFTRFGGASRSHVAAVDGTTGSATAWNPGADADVLAVLPAGGRVYLGGRFTKVAGQPRDRVAAVDAATGTLAPLSTSLGGANTSVRALALSDGSLYIGGSFSDVDGRTGEGGLGRIDAVTGADLPFSATVRGDVDAIVVLDDGDVVAGGTFDTVERFPSEFGIARFGPDGASTYWRPPFNPGDGVDALAIVDGQLVLGGLDFKRDLTPVVLDDVYQRRGGFAFVSPDAPSNYAPPSISRADPSGPSLTCDPGLWTGDPTLAYQWSVDGRTLAGAAGPQYTSTAADEGHELGCTVTATNASGSLTVSAAPFKLTPVDPTPPPTSPPTSLDPLALTAVRAVKSSARVTVRYHLNRAAKVRLTVTAPGRRAATVFNRSVEPGSRTAVWNRRLHGRPAPAHKRYRLTLTATAGGRTRAKVLFVRL